MKKPMLLSNDEFYLNTLDYSNKYISIKRDGIRAELIDNKLFGRSLKIFRNPKLHEYFKNLTMEDGVIIEGEIYCDGVPCREMAGIVNSLDKDIPEGTKLYVFGMYHPTMVFIERYVWLQTHLGQYPNVELVEQHKVNSAEEVVNHFDKYIGEKYEGAVLMSGLNKYKQGRVTIKEGIGYKLKPHREDDLLITGVNERMKNTSEPLTNELGRTYRRDLVDEKEPTGIAATFECQMESGETTKVTITGDEASRKEIWDNQEDYIGKYVIVKSMSYGTKDKLRHPRMIGIKHEVEK